MCVYTYTQRQREMDATFTADWLLGKAAKIELISSRVDSWQLKLSYFVYIHVWLIVLIAFNCISLRIIYIHTYIYITMKPRSPTKIPTARTPSHQYHPPTSSYTQQINYRTYLERDREMCVREKHSREKNCVWSKREIYFECNFTGE